VIPSRFALLVGNHAYNNPNLAQLSASAGDATDFAAILQDEQFGGFDEVKTLIDQPVDEIRKGMARFFSNHSRDDLLLLYFTGHGILDDRGKLYLAARDTEPDLLSATAIDSAFVTDAMDRCRSTRQVLILDCCHSGAFARGAKGAVGGSVGTATAFQGSGSGRVILTATDATQYAWEGDRIIGQADNSLFTHYLLEGLRTGKADLNQDGWITLDEWYDYVFDQVIAATPKQTPAKWSYKQQGEIWVARNPHPAPKESSLSQELQDSLTDPRAWVREGAAAELIRLLQSSPEMTHAAENALQTLVMDDSRRVSSAAAAGLEEHRARGVGKASAETIEIDQEMETAPVVGSGEITVGTHTPEGVEKVTVSHSTIGMLEKITTSLSKSSWVQSPLFPVIVTWCLGWFLSLGLGLLGNDSRQLFLGWGIAGLSADLSLWRFYRLFHMTRLPLLTIGWPLSLLAVFVAFRPFYNIFDSAGSDTGKALVTAGFLVLWMLLAALFSSLRLLPASQKSTWPKFMLTAVLCWGASFLLSLVLIGFNNWNAAVYHFVYENPQAVKDVLGGSLYSYLALSANGILTAILGFYIWSRIAGIKRG